MNVRTLGAARVIQWLGALSLMLLAQVSSLHAQVYLVELKSPPLVERLVEAGAKKGALQSKQAELLLQLMAAERDAVLSTLARGKRRPEARQYYRYVSHGFSVALDEAEAALLAKHPEVRAVVPNFDRQLQTDASPEFIGAREVWNQTGGTRGAGVVIGVIDSGIAAGHPAFAEVDATGFRHQNPRAVRFGLCNRTTETRCNNKLIGIYDYSDEGARDGSDTDGHGTHVASTAAGGFYRAAPDAPNSGLLLDLSGVAPHANVISYKACRRGGSGEATSCPVEWLVAALDQAAADGVEVVNYSIGGSPRDSWQLLDVPSDERSMFNLRALGTVVVVAAGNAGPLSSTVTAPGLSPWVLAVANQTSDRVFRTTLTDLSGSTLPPASSFSGPSISAPMAGSAPIVLGERFGSALCSRGNETDFPPTGVSNPFTPTTFSGQIVLCERGVQARVAKSRNLALSGAGGMILINTALEGESTVADGHFVPSVHLGQSAGERLRTWLRNTPDARGRITGSALERDPQAGDVLNVSSGRGPVLTSVLKPNISAPGTGILAADFSSNNARTLSGTSMSAPHIAGAAALLKSARPSFRVEQIVSALQLTALPDGLRKQDAIISANAFDRGSGRAQIQRALRAGLFLPLSNADFRAGNPRSGGDPSQLNMPELFSARCLSQCNFRRVVQDQMGGGRWRLESTLPAGARLSLSPSTFTLAANASQALEITLNIERSALLGTQVFGELRFVPENSSEPVLRMPIAVFADPGALPSRLAVTLPGERGVVPIALNGLAAFEGLRVELLGFSRLESQSLSVANDSNIASNAFNDAVGTSTHLVTLGAADKGIFAEISSNADVDLFVGLDGNANGIAESSEILCRRDGATANESCALANLSAGRYWILVHNPSGSNRIVRLDSSIVGIRDAQSVRAPARVAAGTTLNLEAAFDVGHLPPATPLIGMLSVKPAFNVAHALEPIVLTATRPDSGPEQAVLLSAKSTSFQVAAGAELARAFSELSAGKRVNINVQRSAAFEVSVFAVPLPQGAASGLVEAAQNTLIASNTGSDSADFAITMPVAARLLIRARNSGAQTARISMSATHETQATTPLIAGVYFNPTRSGHGVFLTREGVRAQLVWYSYDSLGAPVFYLGFNDDLFAGQRGTHSFPMSRYLWDGTQAFELPVGEAQLTVISATRMQWSWRLPQGSGSEPMELLTQGGCTAVAGITRKLAGLWFQPELPGYGANVSTEQGLELVVSYLYDGRGEGRWLLGDSTTPGVGAIELFQYSGFCPGCSFAPVSRSRVGQLSRSYPVPPALSGSWSIDANLQSGASGRWQSQGQFVQLTQREGCP